MNESVHRSWSFRKPLVGWWLLAAAISMLTTAFAVDAPELPVRVEPGHAAVAAVGRFSEDYRFGWTATHLRIRFHGTAANAMIRLTRGRRTALQVVVNGEATRVLSVTPEQTVYALAEGLPEGEHVVEVWKRPEGYLGEMQFLGFQLSAGATPRPAPPAARRLLVIGDSISCGYGNEAREVAEGNTVDNENGYKAYGPSAARALGADVTVIGASGRGMFRNRSIDNDRDGVLPQLFERTLPLDPQSRWDHARFVPQVVVINLGTNDLARGPDRQKPELMKEDFLNAYRAFLRTLRGHYPEAHVLVAVGPMSLNPLREWLGELSAEEERTHLLVFERREGREYFGGNWHPSVAMHEIMAATLVAKIRSIPDLAWTPEEARPVPGE